MWVLFFNNDGELMSSQDQLDISKQMFFVVRGFCKKESNMCPSELLSADVTEESINQIKAKLDATLPLYTDFAIDGGTYGPEYSQKFFDAGNQVVALMYGLAFGFYLAVGEHESLEHAAASWRWVLLGMAFAGNIAVGYLIFRLACHERRLIRTYSQNPILHDAVWSAWHMRAGLLAVNFLMYAFVVGAVLQPAPDGSQPAIKVSGATAGTGAGAATSTITGTVITGSGPGIVTGTGSVTGTSPANPAAPTPFTPTPVAPAQPAAPQPTPP
ncbi:hypothetical protein ACC827_26550 [Rhizobium ruizarguesonis]